MLRFVANGWMAPCPPTVFHVCGETVFWIKSMSDWKSAWLPPAAGAPNGMDGVEPMAGAFPPAWNWASDAGSMAESFAARLTPLMPTGGGPYCTDAPFRGLSRE